MMFRMSLGCCGHGTTFSLQHLVYTRDMQSEWFQHTRLPSSTPNVNRMKKKHHLTQKNVKEAIKKTYMAQKRKKTALHKRNACTGKNAKSTKKVLHWREHATSSYKAGALRCIKCTKMSRAGNIS